MPEIAALNEFATGGLEPDRTLLLRMDPATGRARLGGRGGTPTASSARPTPSSAPSRPPTTRSPTTEPERFVVLDASAAAGAGARGRVAALGPLLQAP